MPQNHKTPESKQPEYAGKYWQRRIKENELFNNWLQVKGVKYE